MLVACPKLAMKFEDFAPVVVSLSLVLGAADDSLIAYASIGGRTEASSWVRPRTR
jgi:hypothetical protein